jgi:hypothetical protein
MFPSSSLLPPAILALAFLTGCASSFRPPEGDEVARLRVVSSQSRFLSGVTKALIYPSGSCEAPMSLGFIGGINGRITGPAVLGMPGANDLHVRTFIERQIPAGSKSLFTVRPLVNGMSCTLSFSFLPETGADYEARLTWDADGCRVALRRIYADGVSDTPVESFMREKTCMKGL